MPTRLHPPSWYWSRTSILFYQHGRHPDEHAFNEHVWNGKEISRREVQYSDNVDGSSHDDGACVHLVAARWDHRRFVDNTHGEQHVKHVVSDDLVVTSRLYPAHDV